MRPKSPEPKKKVNMSLKLTTIGNIRRLSRKWKMYQSHVLDKIVLEAYERETGKRK